jgi:hypothetical protein
MSNRTRWLVACIGAVALIVVSLAFIIPGEIATRLIAASAFVIAMGKTAYDIWDKERERTKKANESRENVKATVKYGYWDSTGEELGVILYNESSSTPVHIQSVNCHYKLADGQSEERLEFDNIQHATSELLLPKHTAKFRYGLFQDTTMKLLATLPEERLWISVASYQGEVCRVGGKDIQAVLKAPPTNQVNG